MFRPRTVLALALVVFAAVPALGVAQAAPSADTVLTPRLRAIVVSASRLDIPLAENPAATTVVRADALRAAPKGVAIDEALLLVPGVRIENQANEKRVHLSLRGQGILTERGVRGTRVMLDGIPLNDPSGFASDLFDVDWVTVAQTVVQRGPAASLYGGGSSAGVIGILTPDGAASALEPMASAAYGSHGFWRATGQLAGTVAGATYRTSYTHLEGDGYRVHTAFHGDNVQAKGRVAATSTLTLTPVLWYTDYFTQNAEGLNLGWLAQDRRQANPDAITYDEYMDTRRVVGGLGGRLALGNGGALSFSGFVRRTAYEESVPSSVQHRTATAPGLTIQATRTRELGGVQHHLSVGTDVQRQTIDEFRRPNLGLAVAGFGRLSDQTLTQTGLGAFAIDRIELSPVVSAMLNVRYDHYANALRDHLQAGGVDLSGDADFARLTGRVGLAYEPSATFSLYGNVGEGYLPPATEELANNPEHQGGFNRSLRAATSFGGEVGMRGVLWRGLLVDVSAYRLDTEHDFDRYRVASRPLETFYRNSGASRRYGAEASLGWLVDEGTLVQVAYTWSNFRYTNTTGTYGNVRGHRLPNSPEHHLVVDAAFTPMPHVTVGATTETVSRWYVDPTNVASANGYTLIHARAALHLPWFGRGTEVTFQARNVFGAKYFGFTEPDPDGNSYQPAATRELFVGFRVAR